MKLVAISKRGNMFKVGATEADSKWFFLTPELEKSVKGVYNVGDDIEIVSEQKGSSNTITSVSKAGEAPAKTPDKAPVKQEGPREEGEATPERTTGGGKSDGYDKEAWIAKKKAAGEWKEKGSGSGSYAAKNSPEVQDSIKRQAIGNMTSRALIALQGNIPTVEELADAFDFLYKRIEKNVNGEV
jgi:hypothetical protein